MNVPTTPNLPAPIVGKFNLAMTESKFQALADEAATLIFNEDNISKIKDFLDRTRKVEKAIEQTHKEGKAEALEVGRQWDACKNAFLATALGVKEKPQAEYTRLCQEVESRKIAQANERARIDAIRNGIDSNAILFAKQIADCTTSAQLTAIESKINLEKTRKEKYQEFLPDAVTRFTELNTALANQKKVVKQLEENARLQSLAKEQEDADVLMKLQQQQKEQEAQIQENAIKVQETAIDQSVNAPATEYVQEVLPTVSARRTVWKYEVINEKEVMKKAPDLVVFSIDEEKVKLMLKTMKDTNQLEGKTEMVVNGIRFYEHKTF